MHHREDIPAGLPPDIDDRKRRTVAAFQQLRDNICARCESIEDSLVSGEHAELPPGRFVRTPWQRPGDRPDEDAGGGVMSIMRGRVFEKIGVNVSEVQGVFSETFAREIPGTRAGAGFWATGISLVAHMRSPHVPAVHLNVRHIVTDRWWFGGGGDLTPTVAEDTDTRSFHEAYRAVCDRFGPDLYPRYRKWCDEYFWLPHRGESRGVGGIFFDYLNSGDWERDFDFACNVGRAHLNAHPPIVERRMHEPWTVEDRERQLRKRGRYVEFNLVYDRGTRFGLMTRGNPEAVLMSLPPAATWP